jgi:hypothetical protein
MEKLMCVINQYAELWAHRMYITKTQELLGRLILRIDEEERQRKMRMDNEIS